jgi:hypothetical protein
LDLLDHAFFVVGLVAIVAFAPADHHPHERTIPLEVCHSELTPFITPSLHLSIVFALFLSFLDGLAPFNKKHFFLLVIDLVHEDIPIEIINPLISRAALDLEGGEDFVFIGDAFFVDPGGGVVKLEGIEASAYGVDGVLHLP